MIKTVLGSIKEKDLGITLAHEHICCYSEYLFKMAGGKYLDKKRLLETSVKYLKMLKNKYGLNSFVDCTPVNIGRDISLLKKVSKKAKVNIICATGFYYTDEQVIHAHTPEYIADKIIIDAKKVNAGIIKCAVESENLSDFNEKMLKASALVQLNLGLPIVLHTNANNKNGLKALQILLSEGVKPQAITVGHLSDTEDLEYIKQIAKYGCFIGYDRLYEDYSEGYISNKVKAVTELCGAGYEDKILFSHDSLFFNGFEENPEINEKPRLNYCFDIVLPKLPKTIANKIITENPLNMLKCGEINEV